GPDAGRTRFVGSGARITAFAKELRSDWQAGFSTLRPSCHAMPWYGPERHSPLMALDDLTSRMQPPDRTGRQGAPRGEHTGHSESRAVEAAVLRYNPSRGVEDLISWVMGRAGAGGGAGPPNCPGARRRGSRCAAVAGEAGGSPAPRRWR